MVGIVCSVLLFVYGIGIIICLAVVIATLSMGDIYENLPKVYSRLPRICSVAYLTGYVLLWPAVLLIYLLEKPAPRQ